MSVMTDRYTSETLSDWVSERQKFYFHPHVIEHQLRFPEWFGPWKEITQVTSFDCLNQALQFQVNQTSIPTDNLNFTVEKY